MSCWFFAGIGCAIAEHRVKFSPVREFVVACILGLLVVDAKGASFDCSKATTRAETSICADQRLSQLDDQLAQAYATALAKEPAKQALINDQRAWIANERDKCEDAACIDRVYSARIAKLGGMATITSASSSGGAKQTGVATETTSGDTKPETYCGNLDAAVKTALDSRDTPSVLREFGGRSVMSWSTTDYAVFLTTIESCQNNAEAAPTIYAFPSEARALLSVLQQRASHQESSSTAKAATEVQDTPFGDRRAGKPTGDTWHQRLAAAAAELDDWQRQSSPPNDVFRALDPVDHELRALQVDAGSYRTAQERANAVAAVQALMERENAIGTAWRRQQWTARTSTERGASNQAGALASGSSTTGGTGKAAPFAIDSRIAAPDTSTPSSAPQTAAQNSMSAGQASVTPSQGSSSALRRPPAAESDSAGLIAGLALLAWLLVVITGIVEGGWRKEIVVFRNFDDLALTFFTGIIVIGGGFLGWYLSANPGLSRVIWGASTIGAMALSGWIVARTWQDNPSAWKFALALITKVSVGVIFLNYLVTLINPGGKTWIQRSRNRGFALLVLMVLTPIVMRLVRDHKGIWAPKEFLGAYHRSRLGI